MCESPEVALGMLTAGVARYISGNAMMFIDSGLDIKKVIRHIVDLLLEALRQMEFFCLLSK